MSNGFQRYRILPFLEYPSLVSCSFSMLFVCLKGTRTSDFLPAKATHAIDADAERAPEKKKNHRALDDIKESIAELKYMKAAIFKKPQKC